MLVHWIGLRHVQADQKLFLLSHQVFFNRLLNKCSRLHDGCQDSAALLVRVYALVHKLAAGTDATEFQTPRRARESRVRGLHGNMIATCVGAISGPQTLHAVVEEKQKKAKNRVQVQQLLRQLMCINDSRSLRTVRLALSRFHRHLFAFRPCPRSCRHDPFVLR